MNSLAKMNRRLEVFWWVITIILVILIVIMAFVEGWDKWAGFFLLPVISAILALVRRFMAKRLQKSEAFRDKKK
jgi:membrane protein implicated in regulation of membrane protease activity